MMTDRSAAKRGRVEPCHVSEFLGGIASIHRLVGVTDLYHQGHALGRGGCAVVYKVKEKASGRAFACKSIPKQLHSENLDEVQWHTRQVFQVRVACISRLHVVWQALKLVYLTPDMSGAGGKPAPGAPKCASSTSRLRRQPERPHPHG